MKNHIVKVYPSKTSPDRNDQLAWKFAELAVDSVAVAPDVADRRVELLHG